MTPDNLAVCFAPTLCCGPDQLEDAKMSSTIRRVLTAAIEQWPQGLREACGTDEATFLKDLKPPARMRVFRLRCSATRDDRGWYLVGTIR